MLFTIVRIDPKTGDAVETPCQVQSPMPLGEALQEMGIEYTPESRFACFNERIEPSHVLHEGDRIDFLAPLMITPQEARRIRAQKNPLAPTVRPARHGGRHQLLKK